MLKYKSCLKYKSEIRRYSSAASPYDDLGEREIEREGERERHRKRGRGKEGERM